MKHNGVITSLHNQVAEVTFYDEVPQLHEILKLQGATDALLEVFAATGEKTVQCLILNGNDKALLHSQVTSTGKMSDIPVGRNTLGRILNSLGEPEDGEEFLAEETRPLFPEKVHSLEDSVVPSEVLETGIKVIDFFCPLFRGGKMGLFGGAGLGKTVLLSELMNSIVVRGKKEGKERISLFTAVGERIREAQELSSHLAEAGVLKDTAFVMGQMGENPALRFRTAAAGVTQAEYFRDELKTDVLFFVDNMYRYAQAGYELATQQNVIPSEDGYQPNLPTQIGTLHERLASTKTAAITTVEAVYLPSDDISDYSVRSIMPYLDSLIVLSREVYQEGRLPAIDILASTSSALQVGIVSDAHYEAHEGARKLLEHAVELERIVSLVGMNELSPENRQQYNRAQILKNYMTQPFVVVEEQSGVPGAYVPLAQTIADVQSILRGDYDAIEPSMVRMNGALAESIKKQRS